MSKIKKIFLIISVIIISLMSCIPPTYAEIIEGKDDTSKKGQYQGIGKKGDNYYAVYYDDEGKLHVVDVNWDQGIAAQFANEWSQEERDYLTFNKQYQDDLTKGESAVTQELTNLITPMDLTSAEGWDPVGSFVDAAVGLFLWPLRLIPIILGTGIGLILGLFNQQGFLSLTDILFNKLPITDIDFFDFNSSEDTVNIIRQNVAVWYYGIRNLAAVLLVIVCVYVGLRMAMSTVSEEKAHYKQMLIDWFTSLCLLFVLHYIMIIIIRINNALVFTMGDTLKDNNLDNVLKDFLIAGLVDPTFSKGFANALVYGILELMTFIFLLTYIKRMITVGFLIVISPLVTVTYSIDRMGDGKSQALNNWFKEFAYNILIQPFQCVTYLAMTSVALEELKTADLKAAVVAICMISFIVSSEEIIKHIFHFESKSMAQAVASAAVTSSILTNVTKATGSRFAGDDGGSSKSTKKTPQPNGPTPPNNPPQPNGPTPPNNPPQPNGPTPPNNPPQPNGPTSNGRRRSLRSLRRAYFSGARKVYAPLVGGTIGLMLGMAAGNAEAGVTTALSLGSVTNKAGKNINNRIKTGYKKRDVARTFNNYKKASGLTDDQVRDNGKALLNGTRQPQTPEEQEYLDAILAMKSQFKDNGDEKDEAFEHTEDLLDDVADGKVSETSPVIRLVGNIRDQIRNGGGNP